jgi:hypothetical protein
MVSLKASPALTTPETNEILGVKFFASISVLPGTTGGFALIEHCTKLSQHMLNHNIIFELMNETLATSLPHALPKLAIG